MKARSTTAPGAAIRVRRTCAASAAPSSATTPAYRSTSRSVARRPDGGPETRDVSNGKDGPWELIRWVARQAPYWAARVEGLGRAGGAEGRGESPRCLITLPVRAGGGSSELSRLQVNYYDLKRAIGELGWRHPDGAKLQLIVEKRLESESLERIARAVPGRIGRKGVRAALDEAYYWICHPACGRFLSWEAWNWGGNGAIGTASEHQGT